MQLVYSRCMKINTKTILLDLKGKSLKIRDDNGEVIDLSVGEFLVHVLNRATISPKILWSVLPKIASEDEVEITKDTLEVIKKAITMSMEQEPRHFLLVTYGKALDYLETLQ